MNSLLNKFQFYRDIAQQLFDFMNGYINKRVPCNLIIDLYGNSYATIVYPNTIIVYLNTIFKSYQINKEGCNTDADICINTILAWSIAHELFHSEHEVDLLLYDKDSNYHNYVENTVDLASLKWVNDHSDEIYNRTGIVIDCRWIISIKEDLSNTYKQASIKDLYTQTLRNVLVRDDKFFSQITVFNDDDKFSKIIIIFNDTDSVCIKNDYQYLEYNLGYFCNLVHRYATQYNKYYISGRTIYNDDLKTAKISFQITNHFIELMKFDLDETLY